jgi:hypothetical protein
MPRFTDFSLLTSEVGRQVGVEAARFSRSKTLSVGRNGGLSARPRPRALRTWTTRSRRQRPRRHSAVCARIPRTTFCPRPSAGVYPARRSSRMLPLSHVTSVTVFRSRASPARGIVGAVPVVTLAGRQCSRFHLHPLRTLTQGSRERLVHVIDRVSEGRRNHRLAPSGHLPQARVPSPDAGENRRPDTRHGRRS